MEEMILCVQISKQGECFLKDIVASMVGGVWLIYDSAYFGLYSNEEELRLSWLDSVGRQCHKLSGEEFLFYLNDNRIGFDWTQIYHFNENPLLDGACDFAVQCIDMTIWRFISTSSATKEVLRQRGEPCLSNWREFPFEFYYSFQPA